MLLEQVIEQWDPHKVISSNNVNLSELFWQNLKRQDPKDYPWYIREIPGFVVLTLYFVGGMALVPLL